MILVTGGTGLVGSHLLYELAQRKEQIVALVRDKNRVEIIKKVFSYYSDDQLLINNIEFIEGDILDVPLLDSIIKKVDYIYHCAAVVSFNPRDIEMMYRINIEGTTNVVNCALSNNVKKLCHVSSTAAIGKDIDGGYNTEKTLWSKEGASQYSITKYLSEQEVWRGIAEGLNAVIVNPSIILGPGDWGKSSTSLYQEVWKGLKFYTTGSNAFVDVRDVANCMIKLMESAINNERFLTFSENLSFKDLLTEIAISIQKSSPQTKATPLMTDIGWRFEKLKYLLTGKTPRITKESAKSGQSVQLFSNAKIKAAIGYEFIPIKQSIRDTGKLFLNDLNL